MRLANRHGAGIDENFRRRFAATLLRVGSEGDGLPSVAPVVSLVRWIRGFPRGEGGSAVERLGALLEADAAFGAAARAYTGRLARAIRASSALAEAGVLPAHGFFAELRERLVARMLPSHRPPHELGEILREVFEPVDAEWLSSVDDVQLARVLRLLAPDDAVARSTLLEGVLRAIDIVAHRLAAAGDDPVLAGFDPNAIDFDSPFLAQASQVLSVTARHRSRRGARSDVEAADASGNDAHARVLLSQCSDVVSRLRRRAPKTGATIRMTYDLERIDDLLGRMACLLDVVDADSDRAWTARAALFRRLALAQGESTLILPLLRRGSQLVTSEIVSHAGRSGEHYITRTRREWGAMWAAAAGAGLIVACLAAIKVGLAALHAPPLIEAALFSTNYALGFILVQAVGFTIATKQPAMTAAALADSIDAAHPRDTRRLIETMQCLVRSQLAAILGNVLVALPAAFSLSRAFAFALGSPIAGLVKSRHVLDEIDPLGSPALLYAALTGVWLAFSGVVAGYGSSSVLARHVPLRIRRSDRLAAAIGPRAVEWLARTVENRTGAILGSIVLGGLLGSTRTIGGLLGIPIDICHVSFASANLGLALATLGAGRIGMARAIFGIAGIGLVNLAVSFTLALTLALRARGRRLRDAPRLLADLARSALTQLPAWVVPTGPSARPVASPDG